MVLNPVTDVLKGAIETPTCSGRTAGEMKAEVRELPARAQGRRRGLGQTPSRLGGAHPAATVTSGRTSVRQARPAARPVGPHCSPSKLSYSSNISLQALFKQCGVLETELS